MVGGKRCVVTSPGRQNMHPAPATHPLTALPPRALRLCFCRRLPGRTDRHVAPRLLLALPHQSLAVHPCAGGRSHRCGRRRVLNTGCSKPEAGLNRYSRQGPPPPSPPPPPLLCCRRAICPAAFFPAAVLWPARWMSVVGPILPVPSPPPPPPPPPTPPACCPCLTSSMFLPRCCAVQAR